MKYSEAKTGAERSGTETRKKSVSAVRLAVAAFFAIASVGFITYWHFEGFSPEGLTANSPQPVAPAVPKPGQCLAASVNETHRCDLTQEWSVAIGILGPAGTRAYQFCASSPGNQTRPESVQAGPNALQFRSKDAYQPFYYRLVPMSQICPTLG